MNNKNCCFIFYPDDNTKDTCEKKAVNGDYCEKHSNREICFFYYNGFGRIYVCGSEPVGKEKLFCKIHLVLFKERKEIFKKNKIIKAKNIQNINFMKKNVGVVDQKPQLHLLYKISSTKNFFKRNGMILDPSSYNLNQSCNTNYMYKTLIGCLLKIVKDIFLNFPKNITLKKENIIAFLKNEYDVDVTNHILEGLFIKKYLLQNLKLFGKSHSIVFTKSASEIIHSGIELIYNRFVENVKKDRFDGKNVESKKRLTFEEIKNYCDNFNQFAEIEKKSTLKNLLITFIRKNKIKIPIYYPKMLTIRHS
jgi:hypothetical protein